MRKAIFIVATLALISGCGARLNSTSNVSAEQGDLKFTTVDPIKSAQTIKVSANATSGTFNLYVFLEKDKAEIQTQLEQGKKLTKVLAEQLKSTKADVQASIPANEAATVLITSADNKKTEVTLRITN